MLSRGEESCGEVGLNSGFSAFFMVGDDISGRKNAEAEDTEVSKTVVRRKRSQTLLES